MCTPVTPAVPYLSTGFAGCSVHPGISRGACKLDRIPRIIKKKNLEEEEQKEEENLHDCCVHYLSYTLRIIKEL
jgi:hypothetical protein